MPKLSDIAKTATDYYQTNNFTPDVLPGCANFVSHCIQTAGGKLGIINYVPTMVDKCENIFPPAVKDKIETGLLIVFERTYDAVSPAGIGHEDDMTHIGIIVIENGTVYFIDYGGSPAKVRRQKLEGWWLDRVQFYLKPPGFEMSHQDDGSANAVSSGTGSHQDDGSANGQTSGTVNGGSNQNSGSAKFHNIKLFYHPAAPQIKMLIDGKEEWVDEMMLSVRTSENRELFLLSHKFEQYPYLNQDRERGKIKAIECHIKWEE